ncbi:hypothetical protein C8J57DRAFT_1293927 [Mycena rebaudengoi]|nr:hypothetical protein C8J57DRAFT_1293927 [Mycena rebaudengoi]
MDPEERPASGPYPGSVPIALGSRDDVAISRSRGSALGHLAILGSVLVPIAFLPYIITRRQLNMLRRKVDEMGANTALLRQPSRSETGASALGQMRQEIEALRQEVERKGSEHSDSVSSLTLDVIHMNEELDGMKGDIMARSKGPRVPREELLEPLESGLHQLHQESETFRADLQEELRLLRAEQDALRSQLFKMADEWQSARTSPHAVDGSELQKLLQEARQARAESGAAFKAIGSSLGDLATFIERIQAEMGHERPSAGAYDPVERMRIIALTMQQGGLFKRPRKGDV